ncbi:hypothetical protein Q5P01_013261 [Channa striata]|uniref:Solute carrier family 39 member 10 n=1 Tax=Channa striata TaxID=64152 RepID=A0AA88SQB7_CHASR|nr:hypothetical protein Q5P01_013261 [Channa striata]
MRVHVHTKFCFLCVLTFLFHQCNCCHTEGHSHQHSGHHHANHNHTHSDLQISEAPYVRGATVSPESKKPQGDALEEEQRFYIQQLFRRYGQKDQLDFQGFQNLLLSLGLGEVKVVDVDHEELGHDHVAHLDLVDIQEGLHSHSSTNEGQGQGHGHGHSHPHHKPSSYQLHTEQAPTPCSQQPTDASPAAGASTGPDPKHDVDHDHNPTDQVTYLCPALLYQIDRRVCIRHYHQMDVEQKALEPVSSLWIWVWGFVSITIISLLSLLGVVLVPILNQSCFKFLLTFLVALAVGTLSGDALLHLLPHSQGQHDHSNPGTDHDTDLLTAFDGVWKGLTALAGIYLLFIIEHCIGMFKHYKDQGGLKKTSEEGKIGRKLSDHKLNRRSDAEWLHLKPLGEADRIPDPSSPTNKTPLASTEEDQQSPTKENGRKTKKHGHRHSHSHGHSHGGNCHSDQEMKDAGIASIAWMVIMGDGMHNFSDGMAIGAAFSANLTGGISTSVAVFCHELPHELGDFAVLLKAGMTVKQAIVYNLLSALMAYVGMLIGTAVGQYTHNVTNWIFAITAGMFLYVALVDMLPEMLHGDSEDHKRCQLGHFILQNLGMLTGFGIMLLIAIFEDHIVFDFGF